MLPPSPLSPPPPPPPPLLLLVVHHHDCYHHRHHHHHWSKREGSIASPIISSSTSVKTPDHLLVPQSAAAAAAAAAAATTEAIVTPTQCPPVRQAAPHPPSTFSSPTSSPAVHLQQPYVLSRTRQCTRPHPDDDHFIRSRAISSDDVKRRRNLKVHVWKAFVTFPALLLLL